MVDIYTYYNDYQIERKLDNWKQITKVLIKKEFPINKDDYEPIAFLAPDFAFSFILKLYEFLTKKKLNQTQKLTYTEKREKEIIAPSFSKPTASSLSKDREITRIVDLDAKKKKTEDVIGKHLEKIRKEKQDSSFFFFEIK